jgi:hypothetical protein
MSPTERGEGTDLHDSFVLTVRPDKLVYEVRDSDTGAAVRPAATVKLWENIM